MDSGLEGLRPTSAPVRKIRRLQLGVLSPQQITKMSVTQEATMNGEVAIKSGIYSITSHVDGNPVYGGVNDPRLGPKGKRGITRTF
jgi:hypothetical protein